MLAMKCCGGKNGKFSNKINSQPTRNIHVIIKNRQFNNLKQNKTR